MDFSEENNWNDLSYEEKNHRLFLQQINMLDIMLDYIQADMLD